MNTSIYTIKRSLLSAIACAILMIALPARSYAQRVNAIMEKIENKDFVNAKLLLEEQLKRQPKNQTVHMLYGQCCLETDDTEKAITHLKYAADKKLKGAKLLLAKAYNKNYQFEEALATLEIYLKELKNLKRDTAEADSLISENTALMGMMRGVEQICVIDSVIVDKSDFLAAYKLSKETGKLFYTSDFSKDTENDGTAHITELDNNGVIADKAEDGRIHLYSIDKIAEKWTNKTKLADNINKAGNTNFPFVTEDGFTLYFATDAEGIGGYDIFVTRKSPNGKGYLSASNVGMPFNSKANDYMMVIDEVNNLGWFATDRNTTTDKVCIYIFVPNSSKQVYHKEEIAHSKLASLAQLKSIKDTWNDSEKVGQAKARLKEAMNKKEKEEVKKEMSFVVNDNTEYTKVADFKTKQGLALYREYKVMKTELEKLNDKIEQSRESYAKTNKQGKAEMKNYILELERRQIELSILIEKTEKEIRKHENK